MKSLLNLIRRYLSPFIVEPEKQNQTIVYVSAIFLLILLFFGVRPVFSEDIKSYQKLTESKNTEEQLSNKIKNLNEAVTNINNIRTDIELINKAMPEGKDISSLLESLNEIFGSNNVTPIEIRFEGPKPSKDPRTLILPMTIHASGNYEDITNVVERLEKNVRQIDFVRLNLQIPEKGDKKYLDVYFDVETYFLKKI